MSWLSSIFKGVSRNLSGIAQIGGAILGGYGASQDRAQQEKFAQNGIQWRVADAKAAGVHPLYALGAQVTPYQSVGDGGAGASMSALGQDISRSRLAQMDSKERRAEVLAAQARDSQALVMQQETHAVEMERGMLENELLRSQIARFNSAQLAPPSPNQGGRGASDMSSSDAGRQRGAIPDYQYVRTARGGLGVVPSDDIANRFDEIPGAGFGWWWRNNWLPSVNEQYRPPEPPASEFPIRPDQQWYWNGQQWFVVPRRPAARGPGGGVW